MRSIRYTMVEQVQYQIISLPLALSWVSSWSILSNVRQETMFCYRLWRMFDNLYGRWKLSVCQTDQEYCLTEWSHCVVGAGIRRETPMAHFEWIQFWIFLEQHGEPFCGWKSLSMIIWLVDVFYVKFTLLHRFLLHVRTQALVLSMLKYLSQLKLDDTCTYFMLWPILCM
jgi:hypothetical protein